MQWSPIPKMVVVGLLAAALIPQQAAAQEEPSSLAGLKAFRAVAAVLTDMPRSPIDSADLQNKLELRLHRMGINIALSQPGLPIVEVTLSTAGTGSNVATAIFASIRVLQLGLLRRSTTDPGITNLFPTWEANRLAISGGSTATTVSNTLLDRLLDEFENAWRRANPIR